MHVNVETDLDIMIESVFYMIV